MRDESPFVKAGREAKKELDAHYDAVFAAYVDDAQAGRPSPDHMQQALEERMEGEDPFFEVYYLTRWEKVCLWFRLLWT